MAVTTQHSVMEAGILRTSISFFFFEILGKGLSTNLKGAVTFIALQGSSIS